MYKRLYEEEHKHHTSHSPAAAVITGSILLHCWLDKTSFSILFSVYYMCGELQGSSVAAYIHWLIREVIASILAFGEALPSIVVDGCSILGLSL